MIALRPDDGRPGGKICKGKQRKLGSLDRGARRYDRTTGITVRRATADPVEQGGRRAAEQGGVPTHRDRGRIQPDPKGFFDKSVKAGKPKMRTVGACMRELVIPFYGVLKNRTPFDPKWS